jgi:hypothetical protein
MAYSLILPSIQVRAREPSRSASLNTTNKAAEQTKRTQFASCQVHALTSEGCHGNIRAKPCISASCSMTAASVQVLSTLTL